MRGKYNATPTQYQGLKLGIAMTTELCYNDCAKVKTDNGARFFLPADSANLIVFGAEAPGSTLDDTATCPPVLALATKRVESGVFSFALLEVIAMGNLWNKRVWTSQEIDLLKEHYSGEMVDLNYLSDLLGRSKPNISKKARGFGLTAKNRPVPDTRVTVICSNCGSSIKKEKSDIAGRKYFYCNMDCSTSHGKVRGKDRIGIPNRQRVVSGVEGNRYNKLTAIKWVGASEHGNSMWEFRCDCGNVVEAKLTEVKNGHKKSCGCLRWVGHSTSKLPKGESSMRGLYASRRKGAKERGFSWDIPETLFRELIKKSCFYCGRPPHQEYLSQKTSNGSCLYNGLDRVDNSKGYDFDNVVTCCGTCNKAKATMTQKEFLDWVAMVYKHSIEQA